MPSIIKCFKKFFTHFIPTEEYESTFIQYNIEDIP